MNLTILDIGATELAEIPKNVLNFRNLAHHIKEIFIYLLPKIEINGSTKITICFGQQGDEVKFDNVLGCTNVFIEDFNFKDFYDLTRKKQNLIVLEEIRTSLIKLEKNSDLAIHKVINDTAKRIIDLDFNLVIPVKKLSKKNKNFNISVERILNTENGEIWMCNIFDSKNEIATNVPITKIPSYLDRTDLYKKVIIENDTYRIVSQFNKVVFETNLK